MVSVTSLTSRPIQVFSEVRPEELNELSPCPTLLNRILGTACWIIESHSKSLMKLGMWKARGLSETTFRVNVKLPGDWQISAGPLHLLERKYHHTVDIRYWIMVTRIQHQKLRYEFLRLHSPATCAELVEDEGRHRRNSVSNECLAINTWFNTNMHYTKLTFIFEVCFPELNFLVNGCE